MPRQENILSVFVASPSDVAAERTRLEEVVTELNQTWSRSLRIRLDLLRWETHSYPGFGIDPQDVINKQITNDYDVFIGIMWHRFGSPTGRAESGTEEEFIRAKAKWDKDNSSINLMIYFKDAPVSPSQIDSSQLEKVTQFRSSLGKEGGLYWLFQSTDDFVNIFRIHLTRVVQEWSNKLPQPSHDRPAAQEPSKAAIGSDSDDANDEEEGLLELNEKFTDDFSEAGDVVLRIGKATEAIGAKIQKHTERFQSITANRKPLTPGAMKREILKVAKDMNVYATKLDREVPVLRDLLQSGLDSLSKAISLWPDFIQEENNHADARESVEAIQTLRVMLSGVETQVQRFHDAIAALPRLTGDLNKAKRSVRTSLQSLMELLRTQQLLLTQTEGSAAELFGS